jgi:predicted phosphodiesterase
MRLAVIADVHGNLPALEAVLADLARRDAAAVVNLGDCLSGPLWPAETADLLMRLDFPTVRGNHDRVVAAGDVASMGPTDRFTYDAIGEGRLRWLRGLPPEVAPAPGILAVHGCPGDDMAYLLDEVWAGRLFRADAPTIAARLSGQAADLVLCGHSHRQNLIRLSQGPTVINPGSVGCPAYRASGPPEHVSESGSPHARYAIASLADGRVAVELLAVEYDHSRAAARAEACGRPDWAHAIRFGFAADA